MKIEKRLIADLKPAEYNPRQISTKQYKDLKESIKKFSLVDPIIINKDNTVIGGHQRLKICKELKHINIDCVVLDLSKEDERELNIRLNKSGGEWDFDILANQFDIEELKDWGFKEIELGLNIDKIDFEGNTEDDHVPEAKESRVKLGDVWQLGNHRLMCGDSTKESDVKKLMNGQKADMVFTDPPYGVNIKGGAKSNQTIAGDLTQTAIPFSFDLSVKVATKSDARFYFCGGEGNILLYSKLFDRFLRRIPRHLIWVKNGFVMKPNNYHNQYEIIFFGFKAKGGGLSHWFSGRTEDEASDVWKIKRDPSSSYLHPTQKPVELAEKAIKNSTAKNGKLYEPFLGSGSTLIACEKTNRVCYGMELDTKYCDVIIERWEQFTGQKAKKCG